jgi:hypothetical protein
MLKKTIKYVDYDGNTRNETFYFNLSQAEIAQLEMSVEGGLVKKIEAIAEAQDGPKIMDMFTEIIAMSYGEKSADGKRFVKSQELTKAFMETEAYSMLFMELITNAEAAAAFINGIVPAPPSSN